MKIAIIGTRGIPANYGGFETCAEELSIGLVKKGHSVTVYCRKGNTEGNPKEYKGVKLIYFPFLDLKTTGTFTHAFFSIMHAIFYKYDVLMIFNAATSPLCIIAKLFRKKIAINVDGINWKRGKWGYIGKNYYKLTERLSTIVADRVVTDSKHIQLFYKKYYKSPSTFIAYGAYIKKSKEVELIKRYNLEFQKYFLQITRFVPENNPLLTVNAFKKLKTDMKLVLVGGEKYKSSYLTKLLLYKNDPSIIFTGYIYDDDILRELWCNCFAYIHGNEVGGTNPALLEALACGNCVIAINVPYNTEVLKESAILYEPNVDDLSNKMKYIIQNPNIAAKYRKMASKRIYEDYTWDKIINRYEYLFFNIKNNGL